MPAIAIIGASRGIGRELVRQYAADGWTVHATVRRLADASSLLANCIHIADVTDEASLNSMATAIVGTLDVVIVNAGIGEKTPTLADLDAGRWMEVMRVNALGPMLAARALGGRIRQGGTFAALTSDLSSIAANNGAALTYRMSKAALNMGLATIANEWRPRDIAVAALHPGWVKTDMGGSLAPIAVEDSVSGLRREIANLAGPGVRFLDHQGTTMPW